MEYLIAYNNSATITTPKPTEIGSTQLKRNGAGILRNHLDRSEPSYRETGFRVLKILLDFSYWRKSAGIFNNTNPQQITCLEEFNKLTSDENAVYALLSLIKYDGVFSYAMPISFRIILCSLPKVDLDQLKSRLNPAQIHYLDSNKVCPQQSSAFTLLPGAILMLVLRFLKAGAMVNMSLTSRQSRKQVLLRQAICLRNPVLREISHKIDASRRLKLLAKNGFFDHLKELPREIDEVLSCSSGPDMRQSILEKEFTVEDLVYGIQWYERKIRGPCRRSWRT